MGLGFTSPYLDQYGQFALESDQNAQLWLQMNQEYYGTPFWHTTPINYHHDESLVGQTVQDIQLGMANNNNNFDNHSPSLDIYSPTHCMQSSETKIPQ